MSTQDKLNHAISLLQGAMDDAQKCDDGRAGAPGTRLRKTCQQVKEILNDIRVSVLDQRD